LSLIKFTLYYASGNYSSRLIDSRTARLATKLSIELSEEVNYKLFSQRENSQGFTEDIVLARNVNTRFDTFEEKLRKDIRHIKCQLLHQNKNARLGALA
jgi:hypothetical protein